MAISYKPWQLFHNKAAKNCEKQRPATEVHISSPFLACLALRFNLFSIEFQFFKKKIECGLYFLDRFDVLMSKMIFKK